MKNKQHIIKKELSPPASYYESGVVYYIERRLIVEPKVAVRTDLNDETIEQLAASIDAIGLISPITLRQTHDKFEVVAGHRRFMAMTLLKKEKVPAFIVGKGGGDVDIIKLHENMLRENVNLVDESNYLFQIMKKRNLSQKQMARLVQRSEAYISDRMAVLSYPTNLLEYIRAGVLGIGVARELVQIKNKTARNEYIEMAVKNGITSTVARDWKDAANSFHHVNVSATTLDGQALEVPVVEMPKFNCAFCLCAFEVQETIMVRACKTCANVVKKGGD